jgi:hypothetical protein
VPVMQEAMRSSPLLLLHLQHLLCWRAVRRPGPLLPLQHPAARGAAQLQRLTNECLHIL